MMATHIDTDTANGILSAARSADMRAALKTAPCIYLSEEIMNCIRRLSTEDLRLAHANLKLPFPTIAVFACGYIIAATTVGGPIDVEILSDTEKIMSIPVALRWAENVWCNVESSLHADLFYLSDDALKRRVRQFRSDRNLILNAVGYGVVLEAALALLNTGAAAMERHPAPRADRRRAARTGEVLGDKDTLVLVNFRKQSEREGVAGGHATPRGHLVRGHFHKRPSGKLGWTRPYARGDFSKGQTKASYRMENH